MNRVDTVWFKPEVREEFHLKIHKCAKGKNCGWVWHCPEHDSARTDHGPYQDWETARDLADLHLRNYNHF